MKFAGYHFTKRELLEDVVLGCLLCGALFVGYVLLVAVFGR